MTTDDHRDNLGIQGVLGGGEPIGALQGHCGCGWVGPWHQRTPARAGNPDPVDDRESHCRRDISDHRVASAYQAGATTREIAAEHGVHEATIRQWLAREAIARRRTGPRGRLDVTDELILELREVGLSYREIALDVGMSKSGARQRWLAASGQPRPGR
jgi:hypothetical protein